MIRSQVCPFTPANNASRHTPQVTTNIRCQHWQVKRVQTCHLRCSESHGKRMVCNPFCLLSWLPLLVSQRKSGLSEWTSSARLQRVLWKFRPCTLSCPLAIRSGPYMWEICFFQAVFENMGKKFWETDPTIWDSINNTGLRCVFFCLVTSDRPTESLSAKCLIISSCLITNVQALVSPYLTSSFVVSGSFLLSAGALSEDMIKQGMLRLLYDQNSCALC